MADRKLFFDLLARDKTKAGTDAAARNLGDVGDAADDAAKKTDKLGKSATANAARIDKLDREAGLLERELHSLARAFADTDDAAERMDLSKAIRKMEADLRKVNKQKGVLEGILPDPEPAAKGFMSKLGGSLAGQASSLAATAGGSVGPVVGAAIGVAAAPTLVSALSSALAGGAGLGVLGVGIMAAVKADPGIQAAGKTAAQRFSKSLGENAVTSLRGPILQSLGVLSDAGDRLNRELGGVFAELSDDVVPFTRKVVGAGEAITGSLLRSAKESGPAIDGLGDSITLLGDGVSSFIDSVSDGGPEAADNLRLIAGATGDLIAQTGALLNTVNKLSSNSWLTGPLIPLLRKHYGDAADASDDLKGSTAALVPEVDKAAEAAAAAAMSYDDMADGIGKVSSAQRDLYGSQIDVKEAILETTEKIRENGAGMDINTKKGRENRQALLDLATTLDKDTRAFRDVNGVSAATTQHMENNRAAFIKAARAAGVEAGEAKKLADRLLGIPVKTEPRISMKGAAKSINDAARLGRLVREFQGTYTATMITNYIRHGKPGTGGGLAGGGLVDGPGTATSDSVPMMLSKGEYVVRASSVARPGVRAMLEGLNSGTGYALQGGAAGTAVAARAGGGAGVQTVRHVFDVTGAETKHLAWLREMFRTGQLP